VIGTTVVVQGLSAPALAKLLGLQRRSRATWLLIGDPTLAVALHRQLRQAGARSLVIAAGSVDVQPLEDEGIDAIRANPLAPAEIEDPRVVDVEAVLALSTQPTLNDRICEAWAEVVGRAACYRWDGVSPPTGAGHGLAVWSDLPTPSDLKSGIASGSYALEALEVGPPEDIGRFGTPLRPLVGIDEGGITLLDDGIPPDTEWVIALRRRIPGLYGLVRDAVVIDKSYPTFDEVVQVLLDLAAKGSPGLITGPHVAEILSREKTMPTTVGAGVAIPHVYDDHVTDSTCYIANISAGLDMRGPDDEPVHLVFLVVSPAGKAREHLRSLAAIARIASEAQLVEVLARQRTRSRMLTILRERE